MEFRRLHPEPQSVELQALLDSLELSRHAPAERPHTIVNFVASVDGRVTLGGRSGGLGDDGDHAMFHGLRGHVDAILAGTVTMRIERYGRLVKEPERRRRREQRGLTPEPLACVVSRSGAVPTDIPLFQDPESQIVIFTPADIDTGACGASVELVRLDPSELTLTTALRRLRSDYGIRSLLCEGGPTLFGSLLREQLVDELLVTVAPKLTGGGMGPTISSGPELADPPELKLQWVLERERSLFLRYAI